MSTSKVIRGYKLLRPLRSGGMGSVYIGEKLATHQLFAVKFMLDHLVEEQSYVVRFEREISALRSIRHPHVVDVFEWCLPRPGSTEPPFIVMELLEGEGLDHLLKRNPVLPPSTAVEIALQILDGLAAAHQVGVVHRDLGPTNVFLEATAGGKFHVKILDFGLARSPADEGGVNVTQEGTLMGKPAYVAPEMFAGSPLDARSDVFACGIMMYRMLTGRFPYHETVQQMLWVERYADRDKAAEYPSARSFVASIPEGLDEVVSRAIRKDPGQRYQSAREMQAEILSVEDEIADSAETVVIMATTRPEGDSRSTVAGRTAASLVMRRRPRTALYAGLIAGIGVLAVVLVVFWGRLFGPHGEAPAVRSPAAGPSDAGAPSGGPEGSPVAAAGDVAEAAPETVHLVVIVDPPVEALVKVAGVTFAGDPPEGNVPKSDEPAEIVVTADGFETLRETVIPDGRRTTFRAGLRLLETEVMDLTYPEEPESGGAEAATRRRDAGAVAAPRDASVVSRPVDAGGAPDAGGASAGPDASRRDAGAIPIVNDAASRLPPDPFASATRLPEDLF